MAKQFKISDLIRKLERVAEEKGDLPLKHWVCVVASAYDTSHDEVEDINPETFFEVMEVNGQEALVVYQEQYDEWAC